jgi:NADH-quinone oxidoreductase subunit E
VRCISTLEDQIAFRDARILTLEERLEAAQLKIEELERKRDGLPVTASTTAVSSSGHSLSGHSSSSHSSVSSAPATHVSAKRAPVGNGSSAPAASLISAPVARSSSKPAIAIPKPADVAKAPALARATNGKREAAREEALTPEPPEVASDSTFPEADMERVTGAPVPPSGPEDVSRITGIGPRFEAALRKQGITSIRQIAAWSDADVRQVAKALKIPKSRIVKGGWIEAAREMIGSRSTSE